MPDEKRAAFKWCLAAALSGQMPPTETGLHPDVITVPAELAIPAEQDQPADNLAAAARAAFN